MSLKVWLPLDGNLENKGTLGDNFTINTTPTYINNGKIGKAMALGSISISAEYMENIFKNNTFSICFWLYVNADTGNTSKRAMFFGNNSPRRYSLFQYPSCNDLHWSWANDTSNNVSGVYSNAFPSYEWTHCAITYDSQKLTIYLNGIQARQVNITYSPVSLNYTTVLFSNCANDGRYLNDYRIYDHALSAAEVHEISQGLVLHYKLDSFQGGYGNPNLITGYDTSFLSYNDGAVTLFTNQMNGGAQEIVSNIPGASKCLHLHSSGSNNRQYRTIAATSGKSYTISVDYYSTSNQNIALHCELNGGNYNWTQANGLAYTTPGKWIRLSATYTNLTSNATLYYFIYCTNGTDCYVKNFKIEEGTSATNWVPNGVTSTIIQDSSGYEHNGTILNTITLSSDTPRYSTSINLTAGNSMINCGRGAMVTDSLTVNLWIKYSTWGNPISCTEGGGWNFENSSGIQFPVYIASVGYKVANAGTLPSANIWHMITGTYNRLEQTVNIYIDGELKKSTATGSSNLIGYHGSNVIWIGAEATGSNTTANNGMIGLVSDVRIYCTALAAADVKQLYEVSAKIDNNQGWHTFEYIDGNSKETITKTGKTMGHNIIETYIPLYDKTIYTEPDGSKWIHIFHHNNPANSKFNSPTTDWLLGKYMDANRWYDVDHAIYNSLSPYEFMVKQKTTSSAAETKYRWRQTANPLTATWTDVKPGTPTFITTTGYTSSNMGGLYIFKSGNLHMCIANGSNGNWFGGIGAASAYNGGIPGYPNTTVTDGYIDLYIRVYANAKIIKTIGINAANLIEF